MPSIRKNAYDGLTLREFREATIAVACLVCDRHGELDRRTLVKQYGASLTFVTLRRRVAMGCAKMHGQDGIDRCDTHFPGLNGAGLSLKKEG